MNILEQVFQAFAQEVQKIDQILKEYNGIKDQEVAREKYKEVINKTEQFVENFSNIYNQYMSQCNSEQRMLEQKVLDLQKQLEVCTSLNDTYKKENDELRKTLSDQMAVVGRAANLMDLIESRINVVANSVAITKRMKDHRLSGEESPRYIHGIDVDELVEMYKAAGFKLTDDILNHFRKNNPKLNYMTLRDRLVKAGVWKGRQSKSND